MQQISGDEFRRRFRPGSSPAQIGGLLGLSPTTYLNPGPSLLPPLPGPAGGQLGRNIILAAGTLDSGNLPLRNLRPGMERSPAGRQLVQNSAVQQDPARSQTRVPFVPTVRSNGPASQPPQRSLFDLAGRFHDFQAGPRIPRPNLAEEFIPVVGPLWDAAADLQEGRYGSAMLNAAMGMGDALPIGYGIKAGRGALKLVREMKTFTPKAAAIQRKMHKIGLALPSEDVHHIFELNGIGRYIPNWRNNPLFLKALPRDVHQRLHRRWGGMPKFGRLPRVWHGTTDWMKAGAAGIGSYVTDGIENVDEWLSANSQPTFEKP
jgi:hypothetical protein